MPYKEQITRRNPTCFLFIVDQSGSMSNIYPNFGLSKSNAVSDILNKMFQELLFKCSKDDGIRDYISVGVVGYGGEGVGSAFGGNLKGKKLVTPNDLNNNPLRFEKRITKIYDGAGGFIEVPKDFQLWFDPIASGGTPMCEAFRYANDILENWIKQNSNSFPPSVIHITDGESTDGNPIAEMEKTKSFATTDGNVILFNLHTSTTNSNQVSFPSDKSGLPNQYAEMLYEGASVLPDFILKAATNEGFSVAPTSRGFCLNADMDIIIKAITIGTQASNLLLPANEGANA